MRTLTIEKPVFNYSDVFLPENKELKQKVLTKLYDINMDDEWFDCIYDDFKTNVAPEHGFHVDKIYFCGFSSQGDGAMFEGNVIDFTKFVDDVRIKRLIEKNLIYLSMDFKHSGRYYHENSYTNDFDTNDLENYANIGFYIYKLEDEICAKYEQLCKKLYKMLNDAHDYLTSDEAILETIALNDYEFDENGNIA